MKDFRKHKVQILGALALAFAMGLAMPVATFASEGDPAPQADGTETETKNLNDSVVTLYNTIQTGAKFASYRGAQDLIKDTNALEEANNNPTKQTGWETVYKALSTAEKSTVDGKTLSDAVSAMMTWPRYTSDTAFKAAVDGLNSALTTLVGKVKTDIQATMANAASQITDTTTVADIIKIAKELPGYAKYEALYDATKFLRDADGTITTAYLDSIYKDKQGDLITAYSKMATAAKAIDQDAVKGLYALPNTSVGGGANVDDKNTDKKPTTPSTGVLDNIAEGSIDMVTLVMIGAASLATLSGLALIAKLYLKHKF